MFIFCFYVCVCFFLLNGYVMLFFFKYCPYCLGTTVPCTRRNPRDRASGSMVHNLVDSS